MPEELPQIQRPIGEYTVECPNKKAEQTVVAVSPFGGIVAAAIGSRLSSTVCDCPYGPQEVQRSKYNPLRIFGKTALNKECPKSWT